jgi:hypothetical protein
VAVEADSVGGPGVLVTDAAVGGFSPGVLVQSSSLPLSGHHSGMGVVAGSAAVSGSTGGWSVQSPYSFYALEDRAMRHKIIIPAGTFVLCWRDNRAEGAYHTDEIRRRHWSAWRGVSAIQPG